MKKEKTNRPKQPMNRRKKYLLLSGTTTLLIVVALVLVNLLTIYITDRYPVSIDLTPQKVFGLTEQSKEYLSKLEQPVSIQVMTNEDTFIASGDYYVQANQVIQEYEKYSDQISLEYVDLLQNPSLASQYEDVQIGDIIVSSGNRTQTLTAYDLFNVESGSYYGSYITSSKAEQAMTSAILNVTSTEQIQVALLSGHGEQTMEGLTQLLQSNNFSVTTINPAVEEIGEEVDVMLWIAPINDPDEQVLERLENFLSQNEEKTLLYDTAAAAKSGKLFGAVGNRRAGKLNHRNRQPENHQHESLLLHQPDQQSDPDRYDDRHQHPYHHAVCPSAGAGV